MRHGNRAEPPLITDASPSADELQSRRRRIYSIIMAVHVMGFAASYPCYLWRPWAGAAVIGITGLLPWVGVILANDAPRRRSAAPDGPRLLSREPREDREPPVPRRRSPS
ncbi:MAG TPA: DUF3099 domain-containing protein [Pseudonocardia sp.]|jgi:hypothetical protein|nr:DUF3099 domain-containing protein [Pseudonocardia sp.]